MDEVPTRKEDKMETFFLVRKEIRCFDVKINADFPQSETLKYLYLLFSDDRTIPLDRMNTCFFDFDSFG